VESGPERYRTVLIVVLAAVLAAGIAVLVAERDDGPAALEITSLDPAANGPMEVYITGAVAAPGVYEVADGDRVVDVLMAAGGPAPDADLERVNLAQRLEDEDRVVVPRQGEASVSSGVAGATRTLVNINTASAEELDALPGIGEVYSRRIVDSRTSDGLYNSIDDLLTRDLIPNGTFTQIRDLITAGP